VLTGKPTLVPKLSGVLVISQTDTVHLVEPGVTHRQVTGTKSAFYKLYSKPKLLQDLEQH